MTILSERPDQPGSYQMAFFDGHVVYLQGIGDKVVWEVMSGLYNTSNMNLIPARPHSDVKL